MLMVVLMDGPGGTLRLPMKRPVAMEGFAGAPFKHTSNVWCTNCHDSPHFPLRIWIDPINLTKDWGGTGTATAKPPQPRQ